MDCVVIEGAGSPAEINLRDGDIVNMSMAEAADAPVLLVGDINLGGVFASLLGTVMLLTEEERARVKGVIINKFRGDVNTWSRGFECWRSAFISRWWALCHGWTWSWRTRTASPSAFTAYRRRGVSTWRWCVCRISPILRIFRR